MTDLLSHTECRRCEGDGYLRTVAGPCPSCDGHGYRCSRCGVAVEVEEVCECRASELRQLWELLVVGDEEELADRAAWLAAAHDGDWITALQVDLRGDEDAHATREALGPARFARLTRAYADACASDVERLGLCPRCGGDGLDDFDRDCPACKGSGKEQS